MFPRKFSLISEQTLDHDSLGTSMGSEAEFSSWTGRVVSRMYNPTLFDLPPLELSMKRGQEALSQKEISEGICHGGALRMLTAKAGEAPIVSNQFYPSNDLCEKNGRKLQVGKKGAPYNFVVFFNSDVSLGPFFVISRKDRHPQIVEQVLTRKGRSEEELHNPLQVIFAGEFEFDKEGKLSSWNNRSGHYKPEAWRHRAFSFYFDVNCFRSYQEES